MGLSCSNCSIQLHEKNNERTMSFSQPPEVYSIERGGPADKAGIRRGDLITHINGRAMDSDDGGRLFANAKPGQSVTFTIQRGAERKTVSVRAAARSTPLPQLAQSSESLEKARESLTLLQRDQAEQLRKIQEELRRSQRIEDEKLREIQRVLVRQEQEHRRKLAELAKELTGVHNRMRAAMTDSARAVCSIQPPTLAASTASRTLRYTGMIGGTEIEVRGANPVSVTESGDEIEITAGGTIVKLKSTKK
jgi:membrane-associated protease RseP (regulator of RpoE activity)